MVLPPYAYVPGINARHPETYFDTVKSTVGPAVPVHKLHETEAWHVGLAYLEAGFFWECHEVLEAVWLCAPDPSAEREMVQAIIQLANARLKIAMKRPRAARRLCAMVQGHLDRCGGQDEVLGLRIEIARGWVRVTENDLNNV